MQFYSALVSSVSLALRVLAYSEYDGGVTMSSPEIESFDLINATLYIPLVSGPTFSAVVPYIGMDVISTPCPSALRVGVEIFIHQSGKSSHRGWYWMMSGDPDYFDLKISSGDLIQISYNAVTSNALIDNLSTNESESRNLTGTCGYSITWGLTASPNGTDSYFPIANFGNITFMNAMTIINTTAITVGQMYTEAISNIVDSESGVTLVNITADDYLVNFTYIGDSG